MQDKKKSLNIATAHRILSRPGGAISRNALEYPGPETILRGLRRFHDIRVARLDTFWLSLLPFPP